MSETFLVRDNPRNFLSIIEWQHFIVYKPMYDFYESIKQNTNVGLEQYEGDEPTLYQRLTHVPHLQQIFQDAMSGISVQSNTAFAKAVDFSDVTHLIDVGGGDGSNILTIAKENPHLKASVFDSAPVCEIAKKNIASKGFSDRLGAIPGDCFKDPFPKEADCILFCHFFTIWSEKNNQALLKKAYDALPKGGKVMIFNMMQNDNEDGPIGSAIGSPYFLALATGEGMLYTWKEYTKWMKDAGFAKVDVLALPKEHGVIIGTKA
jgi:ubiquinone/menaquinone biosynthesis C-methylase UbiE